MIETSAPQPQKPQRVCIRCGDPNVISLAQCAACGFDLTSDLQRDYDFFRDGVPIDAPTGAGDRNADGTETPPTQRRQRTTTVPGVGSKNWRPYREEDAAQHHASSPATATMDLGAAVLEAVFESAPPTSKRTLDLDALGPFVLDGVATPMPDPVACSPTSALRVEELVVVGESHATQEDPPALLEDANDEFPPSVVGAVPDWSAWATEETPHTPTRPFRAQSRPVETARAPLDTPISQVRTPKAPEASDPRLLSERIAKIEPISQRNHIREGASTYVDAMHGSVRREKMGWRGHDLALPFAVATGVVTLVLFALM